jgi:RNA polymerase sigma-70 factor (ECF subfamily)
LKVVDINSELFEWIDLAIRNDREAQRVIYNRYSPKLLNTCRQYISDIHAAEDVLVTAFMKIFTHINKFENKGNFEAWIRRITVNECISFIRANKKVRFADEDNNVSASDTSDSGIIMLDIQTMIDLLPYGCKMVFNLYAIEGYKHQEIAELLGISEGTSKSQLAYARKLLKQWFHQNNMAYHG